MGLRLCLDPTIKVMAVYFEKKTKYVVIVRIGRTFNDLGNAARLLQNDYGDRKIMFIFEAPAKDKDQMKLIFILK